MISEKNFTDLCQKTDEALTKITDELWNRYRVVKFDKIIKLIMSCHRGHGCMCNEETQKACKKIQVWYDWDFSKLKDMINSVEHELEDK